MDAEEDVFSPGYPSRRPYCVFRSRYNAVAPLIPSPANLQLIHPTSGGWDASQEEFSLETLIRKDLLEEIDQAFENVDYNLKHAGGKGWSQVYRVVIYSVNIEP